MDLALLMPATLFGGIVLGAVALQSLLAGQRPSVKERLDRYESRVSEGALPREEVSVLKDRRFSDIPWMDRLFQRTNFAEKIAVDLARAGLPLRVAEYVFVRWLCALGLALVALFIAHTWLLVPPAAAIGFWIPGLYLNFQRGRRVKKIISQITDAIGLISNSLKSGYSFNQGLEVVTREMPSPIADEFRQVLVEMNMGGNTEEALNNLVKRVPSYDIDLMVTAFIIQRQVGGNLAEVLDNIAHTIRERIRILGEVSARTAQARLSGYVVGGMPFFLMGAISVTNPAYLAEMLASPLGIIMLGAAMGMELVGFILIQKIVTIEV
ncbi:MAG TPA: type II secretion system F family protein [Dehalococcoidia bacterium]|nr:type II secretion system F family protein [Dehalococcoidia bacterium]